VPHPASATAERVGEKNLRRLLPLILLVGALEADDGLTALRNLTFGKLLLPRLEYQKVSAPFSRGGVREDGERGMSVASVLVSSLGVVGAFGFDSPVFRSHPRTIQRPELLTSFLPRPRKHRENGAPTFQESDAKPKGRATQPISWLGWRIRGPECRHLCADPNDGPLGTRHPHFQAKSAFY